MKNKDDFNWNEYTNISYLNEIDNMENDGYVFKVDKTYVENGNLILNEKLHPNWVAIYSAIARNSVKSVFECGCGGCYHLYNIKRLFPSIEVFGCDLSDNQIKLAGGKLQIPQEILSRTSVVDFSEDINLATWRKFDFVYTQAVIMHLCHEKAIRFIKNAASISEKYIMFVENQREHNFPLLFEESNILKDFTLKTNSYDNVEGLFLERK